MNKVGLFGILETKIKSRNWNKVTNNICSNWAICTNSHLHSGGRIWIIWDPALFEVDILDVTIQCIHTKVFDKARRKGFYFIVVYGLNSPGTESLQWQSIKSYHLQLNSPWLLCGDFNAIMERNERIGSLRSQIFELRPMADAIRDCQLTDMKARGAFYTWNNKQGPDSLIYSRIDRLFINEEWLEQYPDSFAHFLPEGLFDHCPGLVHFEEERQRRGNSFKYYNMWSMAKEYKEVVIDGWSREVQGTPMFKIEWIENERACAQELTDMVKARDQFLKQKAKCDWMKYGDENTAFFHAAIKKRRARNRVFQVKDMRGSLCSDSKMIQQAFEEYYMHLLGSSTPVKPLNRKIVQQGACLTLEHCAILNAEITGEEVRDAMFAIPGNKALGLDGYKEPIFQGQLAHCGW
ncbi:uncharacterized protein LOC141628972 [Silene latifolia]|uniref:uncharacterized protein LOC141628972 n=1 Tax=Silene latifolia TaxID=37657 RepID=UPI003D77CE07